MTAKPQDIDGIHLDYLISHSLLPHRRPPSHRHAIPSGPWPWIDIDVPVPEYRKTEVQGWPGYPQALYQNWLPGQVGRAQIKQAIEAPWNEPCTIYSMSVNANGEFTKDDPEVYHPKDRDQLWKRLQDDREEEVRLQCLFVDSMPGPVLQMLGTRYNIEPFFFSSALNWIPSRYQEQAKDGEGDHITISLTFIRAIDEKSQDQLINDQESTTIDVHGDLTLRPPGSTAAAKVLVSDLLAIHMVRAPKNSTLITYHPPRETRGTDAGTLHSRVYYAGASVYWSKLYSHAADPTFVLVATLWYALYAWDQTFEYLYQHICSLEETVIDQNQIKLTQQLHVIRAHLLHHESLLDNFKKSVEFVRDTPNCSMIHETLQTDMNKSGVLLEKECNILIEQIERLEKGRQMQNMRVQNVMALVFSRVSIEDTRVSIRDSAIMKQIAFLTMVFLPATFVAGIFGMNVKEINPGTTATLPYYAATIIPLTGATIWIVVAIQVKYQSDDPDEVTVWSQLTWPLTFAHYLFGRVYNSFSNSGRRLSPSENRMMAAV